LVHIPINAERTNGTISICRAGSPVGIETGIITVFSRIFCSGLHDLVVGNVAHFKLDTVITINGKLPPSILIIRHFKLCHHHGGAVVAVVIGRVQGAVIEVSYKYRVEATLKLAAVYGFHDIIMFSPYVPVALG